MSSRRELLTRSLELVAEKLREYRGEVLLIHHDDADGVCAAALLRAALEDLGFRTQLIAVEKLLPEIIEMVHGKSPGLTIYVDLGSPHLDKITRISEEKGRDHLVLVLDHHDVPQNLRTTELGHVLHLNPELFGYSGEVDITAAGLTYLLAEKLSTKVQDLAHLAVIGSAELGRDLWTSELLRPVLRHCFSRRLIYVRKYYGHVDYFVEVEGFRDSYRSLSSKLTTLAAVGYYRGGPELAVETCLRGFREDVRRLLTELEEVRRTLFTRAEELVKSGLAVRSCLQWFHVRDLFRDLGVKVIGLFTSHLRYRRKHLIDTSKYLIGMMYMRREVPGLGELRRDYTKISCRTPDRVEELVRRGLAKPLSELIRVCEELEGVGDGHAYAASGVVPREVEELFLEKFEERCRT